ncbi:hypothetical protein A3Q56_08715, partial [Intoshia linei]
MYCFSLIEYLDKFKNIFAAKSSNIDDAQKRIKFLGIVLLTNNIDDAQKRIKFLGIVLLTNVHHKISRVLFKKDRYCFSLCLIKYTFTNFIPHQ